MHNCSSTDPGVTGMNFIFPGGNQPHHKANTSTHNTSWHCPCSPSSLLQPQSWFDFIVKISAVFGPCIYPTVIKDHLHRHPFVTTEHKRQKSRQFSYNKAQARQFGRKWSFWTAVRRLKTRHCEKALEFNTTPACLIRLTVNKNKIKLPWN